MRCFLSFQVAELISGGAQIAVTNENKIHYLNLLAQYRLASQVREEVEHFLKGTKLLRLKLYCMKVFRSNRGVLSSLGLNELVPENLLAIFDENELEVSLRRFLFMP